MATPVPSVSVLAVKNGITIVSYPPVTAEGLTDVGYTSGGNDGNTNPTDGATRPTEISTTSTTPLLITSNSHHTITAISTDMARVTEGAQPYSAPPLSVEAIVGITVAVVLFVAAIGTVVLFRCVRRGRNHRHYPMGRPEGSGRHLWKGRRRSHNSFGQSPFMQLQPNDSLLRTQSPSASESRTTSRVDSREKALPTTHRSSVNARVDLERAVISGHSRSPRSTYHATTTTIHTHDSDAPPSYRRFTFNLPVYEKGNASRYGEARIGRSKNRVVRPALAVVGAPPVESVDHAGVEDARSDTGSTPSTVPPPYSEEGV